MSRHILLILAAALIGGCSASVTNPEGESPSATINPLAPPNADQSQNFAVHAQYPSGTAAQSQFSAVIDVQTVRIVNPTDQSLDDAVLWVDGRFVSRIGTLPDHSSVQVNRNVMFDKDGRTVDLSRGRNSRLELQSGDKLYTLGWAWAK